MGKQSKKRNWLFTLPGLITSIGGIITAVTTLIVVLHQFGVFNTTSSMVKALKQNKYEFGWSGDTFGSADQKIVYYLVENIEFTDHNLAVLKYSRRGGGEIRVTINDRKLVGTWQDSDGQGELELEFDQGFSRAVGWWNYGGQKQKYNAFMRRAN